MFKPHSFKTKQFDMTIRNMQTIKTQKQWVMVRVYSGKMLDKSLEKSNSPRSITNSSINPSPNSFTIVPFISPSVRAANKSKVHKFMNLDPISKSTWLPSITLAFPFIRANSLIKIANNGPCQIMSNANALYVFIVLFSFPLKLLFISLLVHMEQIQWVNMEL